MVVITDGVSDLPDLTKSAAEAAIASNITTYAVGIGNHVNYQELLDIAGGQKKFVFTTDDFKKLLYLLRPVSIIICDH
jgi:hypothetical protein